MARTVPPKRGLCSIAEAGVLAFIVPDLISESKEQPETVSYIYETISQRRLAYLHGGDWL